jgi:LysM repeat protein
MLRKEKTIKESLPSITFKQALLIVILIHLIGFVAIWSWSNRKKTPKAPSVATKQESGPYSDALDASAAKHWPDHNIQDRKVTETKVKPIQKKIPNSSVKSVQSTVTSVPKPQTDRVYILSAGDNLYMVSRQVGVDYSKIMEHNHIKDVRELRVGQALKIPKS